MPVLEGGKLIQDAACGPHIRLVVVRLVLEQLRAHVVGCTNLCAGKGHGAIQDLGNAQVTQHQAAVAKQEDVLQLNVAVQHLVGVHVVDAQANLRERQASEQGARECVGERISEWARRSQCRAC